MFKSSGTSDDAKATREEELGKEKLFHEAHLAILPRDGVSQKEHVALHYAVLPCLACVPFESCMEWCVLVTDLLKSLDMDQWLSFRRRMTPAETE
jgi:hypothetical protein